SAGKSSAPTVAGKARATRPSVKYDRIACTLCPPRRGRGQRSRGLLRRNPEAATPRLPPVRPPLPNAIAKLPGPPARTLQLGKQDGGSRQLQPWVSRSLQDPRSFTRR